MATGSSLKDYQTNILAKLEAAKQEGVISAGYLGVVVAGRNVLVNMQEISETLPILEIYPVPLVKSWFLGMANVRGVLYAVNDLGELVFDKKTVLSSTSRVLLVNDEITPHVAFLVDRLIGLRKIENMNVVQTDGNADYRFCMKSEAYEDEDKAIWYMLDHSKLVQSNEFVQSF